MTRYGPRQLIDIDIAQQLPVLRGTSDHAGVCAVVWHNRTPLCLLDFDHRELPLPSDALLQRILRQATPAIGYHLFGEGFAGHPPERPKKRRTRPPPDVSAIVDATALLDRLGRISAEGESTDGPAMSLIICTRDRPKLLAACLRSVRALQCPPEEVIVVDNAPSDGSTEAVVREFPGIRYVVEPKPGLSAARNTGIAAASGELIAFTDDDVEVSDNWTTQLKKAFADPDRMAVSGLVLPRELETKAQVAFQSRSNRGSSMLFRPIIFGPAFFEDWRGRGVPCWHIGAGASMAFRRAVFDRVGLFDERLGTGAAGCSEDSEMWYRILANGYSCHYEPSCVVRHRHRRTMKQARSQAFLYMRGHVMALVVQAIEHRHLGNLNRLFVRLPWYYLRQLSKMLWRGFDINAQLTVSEMAGVLAGLRYAAGHIWLPKHREYERIRAVFAPAE